MQKAVMCLGFSSLGEVVEYLLTVFSALTTEKPYGQAHKRTGLFLQSALATCADEDDLFGSPQDAIGCLAGLLKAYSRVGDAIPEEVTKFIYSQGIAFPDSPFWHDLTGLVDFVEQVLGQCTSAIEPEDCWFAAIDESHNLVICNQRHLNRKCCGKCAEAF